ncbi:MAG TPA: hypothetical protein DIW52_13570, partial [Pseudomonas sp.]|nr:hypothetical protein [Pseudomonas sp.]
QARSHMMPSPVGSSTMVPSMSTLTRLEALISSNNSPEASGNARPAPAPVRKNACRCGQSI